MAAGRVGIGTAALVATKPALRALGFDAESGSARVLGRMAGARDISLAAAAHASIDDPGALRNVTLAAAGADAADALIFLAAGARNEELRRAAALSAPAALVAVAGGVWLAGRLG